MAVFFCKDCFALAFERVWLVLRIHFQEGGQKAIYVEIKGFRNRYKARIKKLWIQWDLQAEKETKKSRRINHSRSNTRISAERSPSFSTFNTAPLLSTMTYAPSPSLRVNVCPLPSPIVTLAPAAFPSLYPLVWMTCTYAFFPSRPLSNIFP